MKVLYINGSNRKGNCSKILNDLKNKDDKLIELSDKSINYCLGCNACMNELKEYCVIDDDMQEIYEEILKVDKIVIASPIYMNHITGLLKNVIDRLRENGIKAGLIKIRVFRPFPGEEIAKALSKAKAIAVLDKTPLLNKAKIPAFIIDFLLTKWQFALLLAIAYLIIFYLGLRLLYTLPLMIIQNYHTREAVSKSFSLTRHQNLANLRRMLVISIYFGIISAVGYLLIIFLQAGFDKFPKPFDLIMAIIMLAIIQIFSTFIATLVSFLLFQMTLPTEVFKGHPTFYHTNRINQRKKKIRVTTIVLISFIALLSLTNNYFYLHNNDTPPLRISHRGVDDGNGVQNTIPAMAATIKEHPDFIEMDIHETKDHQFVVMHDENLKNLTGVNKAPYQLTLAQITKLIAHENGHSAHVVSFDDYLAYANKHHQKLLIEIKTTPHDSKNMIDIFLKKYQKDILKYHHEVHSLDYNVVRQIKSKAPEVFVSYILPYNFTYPQTPANAYSMEQSTLTDSFIIEALFNQQKVYAWTVNTDSEMNRVLWLNTDGIITDNLSSLDGKITDFYDDPSYTNMIFNYITVIPYNNSMTSEASV